MINIDASARRCRSKAARRFFVYCGFSLFIGTSGAAELRGFVSEGGAGVLQYQPCNGAQMSQQLFPIDDKTPNGALREGIGAVRGIMLHRYRPLYVEMRGERGKTNATVHQFQRAVGTVESCTKLPRDIPSNVRLLASGEGPFWRLAVTDSSAILELPQKRSVTLLPAAFKTAGTGQATKETLARTYETQLPDGVPLRVDVNPQMCTDGKSETAYGARVTVRSGKGVLQGCAARF